MWFPKISIPSPRRVIGNSENGGGGGGVLLPKILKESMKLNWNFQRGVGVQTKNPPWGEYGYFLEQQYFYFFSIGYFQAGA